ncbi:MAG: CPBP family intramembrane metalloprotease [Deltaproteobacteria bacterium]|nr:CPBP family intramembrane metalloprotease [Deltaproteobacteria bacterium]
MDNGAEEREGSLAELVTLVPLVLAPLAVWRALARRGRSGERAPSARLWSRRLAVLAGIDALLVVVVVLAKVFGRAGVREAAPAPLPIEPTSPFEPLFYVECADMWREQLVTSLAPVFVGCTIVAGLWWRARVRDPGHRARWGLVLVPLGLAPVVGIGAAQAACVAFGGWSTGVGLLGVLAQGAVMLLGGGVAMRLARDELRLVLGPRLEAARTTGLAAVYMLSGLARVAVLVFALSSLTPELHVVHDSGLEAVVGGEHGLLGRGLVLLAAVVVAPPAEEVLFRGLLLPGLAHSMSPLRALVVSAMVFGLFHVPSHGPAAILPGILGLAFGWARLRSGGLMAPIALHVANNLLVTLLAWAAA